MISKLTKIVQDLFCLVVLDMQVNIIMYFMFDNNLIEHTHTNNNNVNK